MIHRRLHQVARKAVRKTVHVAIAAVLPVCVGCAGGEAASGDTPRTGRVVSAAWARPADSGATGGAYFTIVNADSVATALVAVTSTAAAAAEVHESMQHDGMAHMMARAAVPIAPRDSLVMLPGGVHVMLLQLTRALAVGDTVPLTLRFAAGDSLVVRVPVRAP
ncbi:copper chaperone PCu(A)C [Gemmatimonas sp.]|uniref:copper chaperone PCu(A)C n=1 Tax=Gemmatimonas sp. TaxID=1962908 RepID=UPI0022C18F86|nr:copper chaperone PCu(A)C [Gemmatimonas sp.]MCZ8203016.1 copper chaperone PCu(A)C [Gemmatimonas sp.]